MIKILNQDIDGAIKYLNENYPTEKQVFLHICEGYDTIETPDGTGFGVFVKPNSDDEIPEIYIAGDMPNDDLQVVKTLAHEYKHFMQYCYGEQFSEEEAEEFARKVVGELCRK